VCKKCAKILIGRVSNNFSARKKPILMLDKVAHPGKKNHTIRTLTERDGNPGVPGISWDSYDYILDG
jgi:hypothetical protein